MSLIKRKIKTSAQKRKEEKIKQENKQAREKVVRYKKYLATLSDEKLFIEIFSLKENVRYATDLRHCMNELNSRNAKTKLNYYNACIEHFGYGKVEEEDNRTKYLSKQSLGIMIKRVLASNDASAMVEFAFALSNLSVEKAFKDYKILDKKQLKQFSEAIARTKDVDANVIWLQTFPSDSEANKRFVFETENPRAIFYSYKDSETQTKEDLIYVQNKLISLNAAEECAYLSEEDGVDVEALRKVVLNSTDSGANLLFLISHKSTPKQFKQHKENILNSKDPNSYKNAYRLACEFKGKLKEEDVEIIKNKIMAAKDAVYAATFAMIPNIGSKYIKEIQKLVLKSKNVIALKYLRRVEGANLDKINAKLDELEPKKEEITV